LITVGIAGAVPVLGFEIYYLGFAAIALYNLSCRVGKASPNIKICLNLAFLT